MAFRKMRFISVVTLSAFFAFISTVGTGQQTKRSFSVADDIGFSHFISSYDAYSMLAHDEAIQFSPNGEFFSVLTARGRLDLNQVEESVRFYRTSDVEAFLNHSSVSSAPDPVWTVTRASKEESIAGVNWLADSSGVAFIENTEGTLTGRIDKIEVLNLSKKTAETVSTGVAHCEQFEISDRDHYICVAEDEAERRADDQKREAENRSPAIVMTGTNLWEAISPEDPAATRYLRPVTKRLWAAVGGQPFEVKHDGVQLDGADFDFRGTLSLSPDGQTVLTRMRLKSTPQSWEKLYLPPYPSAPHLHSGEPADVVVWIDLKSGAIQPLVDAPVSGEVGWPGGADYGAVWSSDSQAVVLSGTFPESKDGKPTPACVVVANLRSHKSSCAEKLTSRAGPNQEPPEGYHYVLSAQFVEGDKNRVEITFSDRKEEEGTIEYRRVSNGDWKVVRERKGIPGPQHNGMEISVKQAFDERPVLVASEEGKSRMIWDPNPQFDHVDLVQPKIYRWKDKEGREWDGGLYLPAGYRAGQSYPLVIQTHGFAKSAFFPSGSYPTAFAADELAGAGIAVLQVGGGTLCGKLGPEEAACEVSGFDSGARQLASDGIVDLEKVGYIGFSRSTWYGMEMLTNASFPLKASLLADGIAEPYWLFLIFGGDMSAEMEKPFGEGLQKLIKTLPEFNLDKVRTPLLLESEAKSAALEMYQPYASLRYLKKPTELVMINTDEHVITNPVERLASQGLTVDWFRFWLQGYEDPDPTKDEQYKRWRELKKLQDENDKRMARPPLAAN